MPSSTVKGTIYQFRNCSILWNHQIIREDLWVRNGKILNPEKLFYEEKAYADVQIDCEGSIIAPGYIDVQINGGIGVDFSCKTENFDTDIQKVAHKLLEQGVTSFCPTVITSLPENYAQVLKHFRKQNGSKEGAGILGVHLEGPFINVEKKGAHNEEYICSFPNGFKDVQNMYGDLENIAMVTLAPEHENSEEVIKQLCSRGIKVCIGHSAADVVQGETAVRNGATMITHMYNAMKSFHHRDPHLMGVLTSNFVPDNKKLFFGLIADGIHTHPAALRVAHRVHPKGLVLVTDAMSAMGLSSGQHHLGTMKVEIIGKRAVIAGTDTLCGSIARMDYCVRNLLKNADCGVVQALECATLHPAQVLEITDQKGTLDYGTDADFILLDDHLNVLATYIGGDKVWDSGSIKNCGIVQALECATLHPAQVLEITDQKGTLDYDMDADFILLDDHLNVLATYIGGEKVWDSGSVKNCGIVQALECATLHPAQVLEITDQKGTLDYGTDADFILLDDHLNVLATYIGGEKVWDSGSIKSLSRS